jgi:hypothetical protein
MQAFVPLALMDWNAVEMGFAPVTEHASVTRNGQGLLASMISQ